MESKQYLLIQTLADGKFHSGDDLGSLLGITRAAVWKRIAQMKDIGLTVDSVRGKGYILPSKIELFDQDKISQQISPDCQPKALVILPMVDSTNTYAMEYPDHLEDKWLAVLAETQTGGRGRRGRDWVSPFGGNLYLSLAMDLSNGLGGMDQLSLWVAIAVANTLKQLGVQDVSLKWPNDVYAQSKKIAGILLEARGEAEGQARVVIGIGVNLKASEALESVDQPWTSVTDQLAKSVQPERNAFAALVIQNVIDLCSSYLTGEAPSLQTAWQPLDYLADKDIVLTLGNNQVNGKYRGLTNEGHILVENDGGVISYNAGEVSVRATTGNA